MLEWHKPITKWQCRCDCGWFDYVGGSKLRGGKSTQCIYCRVKKHGMANQTPTYCVWKHMRQRCNNPRCKDYKHYGGRGITVCKRWNDYALFVADMGEKPLKMSIERKDTNGNYTPANCKWATQTEQTRNTRQNRLINYQGQTLPLAEWCEKLGLRYYTVHMRLRRNWPIEQAFSHTR